MKRLVVNVATGHYVKGQERLTEKLAELDEDYMVYRDRMPPGSPSHQKIPYAFKAYALDAARQQGATMVLWADASIVPIRALAPVWRYAGAHGVWISWSGWNNAEWTCDGAYPELFPFFTFPRCRLINRQIKHVSTGAFALNLEHPAGVEFLNEFLRLAKTAAFCGPRYNSLAERVDFAAMSEARPCGPPECYGHRQEQTAASVIAWRLSIALTTNPYLFAYKGEETNETVLVADGNY